MDTYIATNTNNGKFYIGSTTDFERRQKEHLKSTKNYPFQNSLRKNPEAFEWEVWSDDSEDPILEQALLDMWFGKECCYNLNPRAEKPPRIPTEDNKLIGEDVRDKKLGFHNPLYRSTQEYKEMQINVGKSAVKNKTGVHSDTYKNSDKAKETSRRNGLASGRPVLCVETGEIFPSAAEASRVVGSSKVGSCCNGARKTAGGFHWEWVYQEG